MPKTESSPPSSFEAFAVGLTVAVLIDASIVRMVLVPATMALKRDANWWLPGWLARIPPHVDIEGAAVDDHPIAVPTPAPTGGDDDAERDADREPFLVG